MLAKERGETRGGIVADDMGSGKTLQMAALMAVRPRDTLIVAPPSVIAHWKDTLIPVIRARPWILVRQTLCDAPSESPAAAKTAITSYQSLAAHGNRPCGRAGCIFKRRWDRVVLDEGHYVRNANTAAYKAVCRLRNDRHATAAHKWVLSGTPINNGRNDLVSLGDWMGLPLLDPAVANTHILRRRIHDIVDDNLNNAKRRKLDEGGKGSAPPPGLQTRVVKVPFKYDHEKRLYAAIRDAYGISDEDTAVREQQCANEDDDDQNTDSDKNEEIGANDRRRAMESVTRLRQLCAHAAVLSKGLYLKRSKQRGYGGDVTYASLFSRGDRDDDEKRDKWRTKHLLQLIKEVPERELEHSSKVDHVVDSLKTYFAEGLGRRALVFCEWRKEIDVLRVAFERRLSRARILTFTGNMSMLEKASTVRSFETASFPSVQHVMLVQVKTGGTGLNLQAASKVIITTPSWNPCNDLQALCRAYRQGQERVVDCERLVIEGTVEEKCLGVQKTKMDCLDELFEEDTFANRMGFSSAV